MKGSSGLESSVYVASVCSEKSSCQIRFQKNNLFWWEDPRAPSCDLSTRMAASLKQDSPVSPVAPPIDQRFKPDLVNKIEVSNNSEINGVVKMPGKDAIITVSSDRYTPLLTSLVALLFAHPPRLSLSDRSVRVWMLRDSGQYWPSVCHYMGGAATALHFNQESRRVFVGLETGIVVEFEVSTSCESL